MLNYIVTILFLVVHTTALAITAPCTGAIRTSLRTTEQDVVLASFTTIPTSTATTSPNSVTFSSLVTIAPLSINPLELRQKCFNDQGFSVNCATWTGYYYTWGGAGHPYAGGPGDSGSGSGSGNGNNNGITGIISAGNRMQILPTSSLVAFVATCVLFAL
jgi:hypothetical protein